VQSRRLKNVYLCYSNLTRAKMGTIKNFEDLDLWIMAREMVNLKVCKS
jgi:hypothetical protein